jgi:hypothetical protein
MRKTNLYETPINLDVPGLLQISNFQSVNATEYAWQSLSLCAMSYLHAFLQFASLFSDKNNHSHA